MSTSTAAQRAYIEALAYETRTPHQEFGETETFEGASAAIDYLRNIRRQIWSDDSMPDYMRKTIFARLRKAGRTKEQLYEAFGIESLSNARRPSMLLGRRCLQWIGGKQLEPDYVETATTLTDALNWYSRRRYERPARPAGYVYRDPIDDDPVFEPDPEPDVMPASVQPAPTPTAIQVAATPACRPIGRPDVVRPEPRAQPVVTTATVPAPTPVVSPPQPIRRPLGRPGVPPRPAPVARSETVVEPVTATTQEAVPDVSRPFAPPPTSKRPPVFTPRALPIVDAKGLSSVETMTRQRLALLNDLLTTQEGIDFLHRLARDNQPSWQMLQQEWQSDIPF